MVAATTQGCAIAHFNAVFLLLSTSTVCETSAIHAGSGNLEASSKAEQGVQSLGDVPWNVFRKSKALWGLVSVHCSFGVGPLVCLSWLPSYYSDVSLWLPNTCMCLVCF